MSLYMLSHIAAWTQGRPLLPAFCNSGRFLAIPLRTAVVINHNDKQFYRALALGNTKCLNHPHNQKLDCHDLSLSILELEFGALSVNNLCMYFEFLLTDG